MFLLLLYVGLCDLPAPAMAKTVRAVRVTINSSPPSATVFVDGKERGLQGYASPSFKLRLTKGPHRLLLELSGYKPLEQLIDVQQTQQFTFTLERARWVFRTLRDYYGIPLCDEGDAQAGQVHFEGQDITALQGAAEGFNGRLRDRVRAVEDPVHMGV